MGVGSVSGWLTPAGYAEAPGALHGHRALPVGSGWLRRGRDAVAEHEIEIGDLGGGRLGQEVALRGQRRAEGQLGAVDLLRLDGRQDRLERADRAGATAEAVAHQADRHGLPLGVEGVDGVLQRGGVAAVVLGHGEDHRVVLLDALRPGLGALLGVVAHGRQLGLGQERQVHLGEVDDVELEACGGLVRDPPGDGRADAGGAGAADDDADLHACSKVPGRAVCSARDQRHSA